MKEYYLNTNNINEWVEKLEKGDRVYLSGTIYTARDAAHKKIVALLNENKPLPFELRDSIIYYAGPTPAKNNLAIGSIGPTTSSRMDVFSPLLLNNGLKAMIGKGGRNEAVVASMVKNKAVYFAAVGGAGALYSGAVTSCEVIAFEDLGCESVKRLTIKDFPLTVAIDSNGKSLFERWVVIKQINYFEMLKNLSSLNYEMFCKILNNQSISKEKVDFNSLQEEIYNNLLGEFISPIEREDIFILQKRLEEEFIAICSFSLLNSKEKIFSEEICSLLKDNVIVFSELKNFKTPKKLLRLTKENKKYAQSLLISIVNCECKSFGVLKAMTEKIFSLCCEIERIILTNN